MKRSLSPLEGIDKARVTPVVPMAMTLLAGCLVNNQTGHPDPSPNPGGEILQLTGATDTKATPVTVYAYTQFQQSPTSLSSYSFFASTQTSATPQYFPASDTSNPGY